MPRTLFRKLQSSTPSRAFVLSTFVSLSLIRLAFVPVQADETVTLDKTQLRALINELVDQRIEELGLSGEGFDARVFEGVEAYIRRAQEAQANAQKDVAKKVRAVSAGEHIFGKSDAAFSIIEYSDFQCPYCKKFHDTPKQLVEKYPDKINWVYRHLPLSFHNPAAQKLAEASECVAELGGNSAFWQFSDYLYQRPKSKPGVQPHALSQLLPLVQKVGVDEENFRECYESARHRRRVETDAADAAAANITGTPGSVLRHNATRESRALSGALPIDTIEQALQELAAAVGEEPL